MGRWIREKLSESLAAALEPPDLGGWSARKTFDRIECDAPSRPCFAVVAASGCCCCCCCFLVAFVVVATSGCTSVDHVDMVSIFLPSFLRSLLSPFLSVSLSWSLPCISSAFDLPHLSCPCPCYRLHPASDSPSLPPAARTAPAAFPRPSSKPSPMTRSSTMPRKSGLTLLC